MNNGIIRLLAVGDVVGAGGSNFINRKLWKIRKKFDIDFTVLNGENASVGNGLDEQTAKHLFSSGADVITSGNHIWHKGETKHIIDNYEYLLRPANYPSTCPGNGYCIYKVCGYRFLVISLLGTVYMESLSSPFECADTILKNQEYDFAIIDFHAEATSEKIALAKYLSDRVCVLFGTHTHVQTADETVFNGKTGYITDLGMTGAKDSVLGIKNEIIIEKFLNKMPIRFYEADGEVMFNGAVFDIDVKNKNTLSVTRLNFTETQLEAIL